MSTTTGSSVDAASEDRGSALRIYVIVLLQPNGDVHAARVASMLCGSLSLGRYTLAKVMPLTLTQVMSLVLYGRSWSALRCFRTYIGDLGLFLALSQVSTGEKML